MLRLRGIYYLIYLLSLQLFSQTLGDVTIYNSTNSNLPYNQINCVEFDVDGKLWVGTENGLTIFDENNNEWINFDQNNPIWNLPTNIIKSLAKTPQQEMFVGTTAGITKVSWSNGITNSEWDVNSTWEANYGADCNPANNTLIKALLYMNSLWVGSTDGLCVEGLGPEGSWLIENTQNNFFSNNITSIRQNSTNNMIGIGTMNGGLVTYDGVFTNYYSSNSPILDNTILDLAFDENNNIIICTPQAGLGVLTSTGSWVWFNYVNSTIPTNSLTNVVVDNNNGLWITTLEDGLVHYRNNTFYHYTSENSNLPDNNINCLQFGPNNHLWLGTENSGLVKITTPLLSNDLGVTKNIKLYPTFVKTHIHLEVIEPTTVKILKIRGDIMENVQIKKGINLLSMENYPSGLYLISATSSSEKITTQIIKK